MAFTDDEILEEMLEEISSKSKTASREIDWEEVEQRESQVYHPKHDCVSVFKRRRDE